MPTAKLFAFIKRDFRVELSYRFNFLLHTGGVIFLLMIFYFISKLVGPSGNTYLDHYNGDYFSFVLIGIAFSGYLGLGLTGFSNNLRQEQLIGTLEPIMAAPISNTTIIFAGSLWSFIYISGEIALYFILGITALGAQIAMPNLPAVFILIILTILSLSAFGIISASFIMVFKRGDPLNLITVYLFQILGGVYFPLEVLPAWLRKISYMLPITHSLEGLRLAFIKGSSFSELIPSMIALSIFTIILLPLSILSFDYAVRRAKINGSLGHY